MKSNNWLKELFCACFCHIGYRGCSSCIEEIIEIPIIGILDEGIV